MSMNSTLLLLTDEEIAVSLDTSLRELGASIATESSTLRTMNGHASDLVAKHDVVVFEADPDDPLELTAIDAVVGVKEKKSVFIALTAEDLSIAKAQLLRSRGVDEVLPKSIDPAVLHSIIQGRLAVRQGPTTISASRGEQGRIVAVAQSTGGSGATTTAVNLATSLAAKRGRFSKTGGASVALLDLDIQFGAVGTYMDLEDNGGFLEMIDSAAVPDSNYLKGILQKHSCGVDVLVAPKQMVPISAIDRNQIASLLDVLKANYDYVILDLPRAMAEWLEPVLSKLDDLIMVSDTSVPAMRQAKRLIDIFQEDNITVQTRVVICRETKPLIKSEQISEGEKLLETKFQNWLPNNVGVARKSVDLGRPIVLNKPGSDIAKAYFALAKNFTATTRSGAVKGQ